MVFNSLHFVWFFLVVYALYRWLPHRGQNWLLLAASYYFYAAWDYRFLALLAASTLVDYTCGLILGRLTDQRRRRLVLGLSIVTFGVYTLFWWYYINCELRDLGRAKRVSGLGDNPGVSTAAFVVGWLLGIFTLYIPTIWTIVTTTRRIQAGHRATHQGNVLNGWIAALLWIFTLGLGGIVFTQYELNKMWDRQPAAPSIRPGAGLTDAELERLAKLRELRESGALSDAEFDAEKARLLSGGGMPAAPTTSPPGATDD